MGRHCATPALILLLASCQSGSSSATEQDVANEQHGTEIGTAKTLEGTPLTITTVGATKITMLPSGLVIIDGNEHTAVDLAGPWRIARTYQTSTGTRTVLSAAAEASRGKQQETDPPEVKPPGP